MSKPSTATTDESLYKKPPIKDAPPKAMIRLAEELGRLVGKLLADEAAQANTLSGSNRKKPKK